MMEILFAKIVLIQKNKNIYNAILCQIACQINGKSSYNVQVQNLSINFMILFKCRNFKHFAWF